MSTYLGKRKLENSPQTSPLGKDGGDKVTPRPRKAQLPGNPAESKINSLEEARHFCNEQGQLIDGAPVNTASVLNLLLWLSVTPNKPAQFLTDGIRSAYQILRHAQETGAIGDTSKDGPRLLQELGSQRESLAKLEQLVVKMAADSQGEMKEIKKDIEEAKRGITEIKDNAAEVLSSAAPSRQLSQLLAGKFYRGEDLRNEPQL